ncbi:hypothetical protein X474_09960 [Dethiosulfatarculus sandiegensis]|uniref:Tyrosine-protein kinase ephrin type A/B receptor-like domain-containing protein n=1 Tax=Dethiosulfatarculus sandiegensis TaxID=1429043 RepID=A0A0D2J8E1_9BACT|nr:hypothetical protein X474_09960 [Dethiosulfatarculus sandiegensis]
MGFRTFSIKLAVTTAVFLLIAPLNAWSEDYKEIIGPYVKKPLFNPVELARLTGPAKCPKSFKAMMLHGKLRCIKCPLDFHFNNKQPKSGCYKCPSGFHLDRFQKQLRCVGCPKGAAYMGVAFPIKPVCRCANGKVFRLIKGKWQCTDL